MEFSRFRNRVWIVHGCYVNSSRAFLVWWISGSCFGMVRIFIHTTGSKMHLNIQWFSLFCRIANHTRKEGHKTSTHSKGHWNRSWMKFPVQLIKKLNLAWTVMRNQSYGCTGKLQKLGQCPFHLSLKELSPLRPKVSDPLIKPLIAEALPLREEGQKAYGHPLALEP